MYHQEKHKLTVAVAFDFKGKSFSSSLELDLDVFFTHQREITSLYTDLGRILGLDCYRHEYDVMESAPLTFSNPTGIAMPFVQQGQVDWDALEQAWHKQLHFGIVEKITNKYFNVENIEDRPKLTAALIEAYQAGQEAYKNNKDIQEKETWLS